MGLIKSTLGEIALEIKTGKTPPTSNPEYFGDELNWYTPTDLDREKILGKSERRITKKAIIDKKVVVLKPNTILLGCIGDIGKIGLIKEAASSNQQITGLLPKEEIINSEFLYYWLKNNKNLLKDNSKNAILSILNNKQLSAIKIEFPENLGDQIRIAEILTQAETLITQRKESILLLEDLLKSTFLEMFGDPVRNEKGWEKGLFRSIAKIDRVHISPQEITHRDYYIGLEDITKNSGEINKTSTTNADELKSSKFKFTNKHVLYAKLRPNLNKVALPNEDGICSTDIFPILPVENISQKYFVCYLMRSNYFVQEMTAKSAGANLPRASAGAIESLEVYKPPISIQDKFAKLVEKAETLKVEYKKSLIELENLFGVLSQKAFKGEIVESEEKQFDKKKDDTVMEEESDEIIDIKDYTQNIKEKVDITNMTFADYIGFPEELQIEDEKWMFMFLEQDQFYQFLLKKHFKDVAFNLIDIETKLHDFFYHGLDMDFDNEKWSRIIFEFMKADPPLIIQNFDKNSATIKLKLTDEAYKA